MSHVKLCHLGRKEWIKTDLTFRTNFETNYPSM